MHAEHADGDWAAGSACDAMPATRVRRYQMCDRRSWSRTEASACSACIAFLHLRWILFCAAAPLSRDASLPGRLPGIRSDPEARRSAMNALRSKRSIFCLRASVVKYSCLLSLRWSCRYSSIAQMSAWVDGLSPAGSPIVHRSLEPSQSMWRRRFVSIPDSRLARPASGQGVDSDPRIASSASMSPRSVTSSRASPSLHRRTRPGACSTGCGHSHRS